MDIREVLKKDHKEAKDLLQTLCEGGDKTKFEKTFATFKQALTAHSRAEEKVLYSYLEKLDDEKLRMLAIEGDTEHGLVDQLVTLLDGSLEKGDEVWLARCKVLRELLVHHIKEEEGVMFKRMANVCKQEDYEMLGKKMMAVKSEELKAIKTAA